MDCFTHMQLEDFLTKSLGPQQFNKLVNEAMGTEAKRDIAKYARRNWQEAYELTMKRKREERFEQEASRQAEASTADQPTPDGAQGGMLKYVFVDVVYTNCMKLEASYEGPNYVLCDSIEEYMRYEQHRSYVAQQVQAEDMKVESKYYGSAVLLNHICM